MKIAFKRLIILTLSVFLVLAFSIIDIPEKVYADGEYDMGMLTMDLTVYSASYASYKIVEEYDEETGPYDTVVFDEMGNKLRGAVKTTLKNSGAAIDYFSEYFTFYDLDKDGSDDLVCELYDQEGNDLDYYYSHEDRNFKGEMIIELDDATKNKLDGEKEYYFHTLRIIFEAPTVKYVIGDKEVTETHEYNDAVKVKRFSEILGEDGDPNQWKSWNTKEDGSGTTYIPYSIDDTIYGLTEDIVLYAIPARLGKINFTDEYTNGAIAIEKGTERYEGELIEVTYKGNVKTLNVTTADEAKDPISVEFKEFDVDGPDAMFYMPASDVNITAIKGESESAEDPGTPEDPGTSEDPSKSDTPGEDVTPVPVPPEPEPISPGDVTPVPGGSEAPSKIKITKSNIKVTGIKNRAWNGKKRSQTLTVKVNGKTLKRGTDYSITYKNRINVGLATITIKGKGDYTGTINKTFKINPKGTSLKKATSAKKALKVTWNKQSKKMSTKRITGYQIQVATNAKFTKNVKKVKVVGYKKTSTTIRKLKAKKTYYVRIRTYTKVSGKTYYSAWSKTLKKKTK